jgi:hypothetical protein
MFTLYLKNDPAAAFPLATANWTIQRAPVDARLVLEATLGAKRAREVGMGEGEPDWNDQIVGRAQQKRSRRSTPFSRPPPAPLRCTPKW